MENKRQAINVLLSEEVNNGISQVANNLGTTKSKVVRFICLDYLTKQNVLPATDTIRFQNL
jgi:antitoxin component of RelBE/YafQ-DinJ toxin-antitoxin module